MAKKSLQARIKSGDPNVRRAAIKQALARPGWRKYVPKSTLKSSRQGRQILQHRQTVTRQAATNERLDAPVTPGSALTERELAQQTDASAAVRYGPLEAEQRKNVGMAEAAVRDVGGWYDQYLSQLQAHQKAVQNIGAQASAQMQGAMAGITGLAGQDLTQLQGQANQGAAQRGVAPAADLSQMASNAAATRQALMGSFAAQQAATNQANTGYASNLAQVVAPGQKLQAMGQGALKLRKERQEQVDTARERGAQDYLY